MAQEHFPLATPQQGQNMENIKEAIEMIGVCLGIGLCALAILAPLFLFVVWITD